MRIAVALLGVAGDGTRVMYSENTSGIYISPCADSNLHGCLQALIPYFNSLCVRNHITRTTLGTETGGGTNVAGGGGGGGGGGAGAALDWLDRAGPDAAEN